MSSAATARSPSPGPAARPCCGLKRSADSSPFRPTPDPPQRSPSIGKNGGGRASPRVSWAEKENDSHHEPRARTPKAARHSTGGSGAAKSFMAPTFSATSKAVAASASPRKRILGERNNEPPHLVPSSPGDHLAHAKPRVPPPTPPTDEPLGAPRRLRLSLDGAPAPPPPAAAAPVPSDGTLFSLDGEAVEVVKPVCEVHRNEEPCHAAAPYDPKKNYLSPRPQYLRYKPNPRVELYRQNSGAKRLEDGFASSESSDDTTTQEEEGISEEEQEPQSALVPASDASADPVTPAAVLPPEPAPVSPPPRAPTPELEEPAPTSPRARDPTPELEPAATPARAPVEKKRKRSSLRFLLVGPLALVLFMAASFVCVPPPPGGSPVVLNASLSKVSDYLLSVQELHPVELAAWLKEWSSGSLDSVTSYWNSLVSSQEPDFFGPHLAANLSAATAEDADPGVGFYYTAAETRPLSIEQAPISSSIFEQELEIQEVVSAIDTAEVAEVAALGDATVEDESADGTEMVQESFSEPITVIEKLNEFGDGLIVEDVPNAESVEEVSDNSGENMASFSQDMDVPSQSEPEPEPIKDDMDVPSLQQDVQTDGAEDDQEEAHEKDQEVHHGHKLGSDMWSGYLDKISKPAVAGSVLAVLIVSAALAFLHMRQNRARVSLRIDEPTEQEPAEQVEQLDNRSASAEQVEQIENRSDSGSSDVKASQLQDPVVEERIGVSGASQYSSSLSSGLGRRKKGKEEEDKDKEEQSSQSLEPMSRRESTGYSTSSYGSFTTYQKISAKKKKKDDEAMTPVRRSSRLNPRPEASS